MSGEWIVYLLFLALIPAMIAKSKGRSFILWYIYGVLLFIIALVHSLIISKTSEKNKIDLKNNGYVECPYCKEPVREDASICPHCRNTFTEDDKKVIHDATLIKCYHCGHMVEKTAYCSKCGAKL